MWNILVGIFFIIGGLSGELVLRGTNSSIALVVVGIVLVILGIVKLINKNENIGILNDEEEETKPTIEEHKVIDEKLVVYNKTHESLGILTELETDSRLLVNLSNSYDRFYKVQLADGQSGYILKTAKLLKTETAPILTV
jgi:hypothetical protein